METHLSKSALLALGITVVVLCSLEWRLRSRGVDISYDDGPPLWAHKRAMVYEPADRATVFIGSSRIKYDLDIPTWERTTGCHAVQLAMEGSSPRPVLENLADDPLFTGRLIVDVTEGLFFSNAPHHRETPDKNLAYFKDQTPAQRWSFPLNRMLESQWVFLDKDNFSLNACLDALEIPSRPGVFMMPIFPLDFQRVTFERQMYVTDRFVADTALQNQVKGIWALFGRMAQGAPPMPESELDAIFQSVQTATDKIRARGGEVLFVRTPSSGPLLENEQRAFPRDKYWDRLLVVTQCPGIHFSDHEALAHFVCPEDSHLSRTDAAVFTQALAQILEQEKNWRFCR